MDIGPILVVAIFIFVIWVFKCLNVLREYERAVVFRLGRVLKKDKGPGIIVILWPIDKIVKVSLRVVTWDVPPQDIITRDNVSLKVNAVLRWEYRPGSTLYLVWQQGSEDQAAIGSAALGRDTRGPLEPPAEKLVLVEKRPLPGLSHRHAGHSS